MRIAEPRRAGNLRLGTTIAPATPGTEHSVDREEVFVIVAGRAHATVDGHAHDLGAA